MTPTDAKQLYDEIAGLYHLLYADWPASVRRQSEDLDRILRSVLGEGPWRILDASCGIGTQALGLATLGHSVTASDLSANSIRRARREAADRGLDIRFSVADMRSLDQVHTGPFDVVLSVDNSIPHLLTDEDILEAFRAFHRLTRPGGVTLVTVRDYAREDRSTPQVRPYGVRSTPDGRCVVFQVWDFEGDHYDVALYFVRETVTGWTKTFVSRSRYYAVDTDTLLGLLRQAGFAGAERLDDVFFQPALLAECARVPRETSRILGRLWHSFHLGR